MSYLAVITASHSNVVGVEPASKWRYSVSREGQGTISRPMRYPALSFWLIILHRTFLLWEPTKYLGLQTAAAVPGSNMF